MTKGANHMIKAKGNLYKKNHLHMSILVQNTLAQLIQCS